MQPASDTFGFRFLLVMIGLALFGCVIAGADYSRDILPDEKAVLTHEAGMGFLFYNKCLYICSLSYDLCKANNPYKNPFRETVCGNERGTCNTTCVQSHAV
jgi:hypothetical protein